MEWVSFFIGALLSLIKSKESKGADLARVYLNDEILRGGGSCFCASLF